MKPIKYNPTSSTKQILIIIAVILAFSGIIIYLVTRAIEKAKEEEKQKCDTFVESLMSQTNDAFAILYQANKEKMDVSKALYQEAEHKTDSFKSVLKKSKRYVQTPDRTSIGINRRIDSLLTRFDPYLED